jgi:endonuclease YncB( thermonuclease family)
VRLGVLVFALVLVLGYASALLRAARQARADRRGLWGACPGTPFDPYHAADTGP